MTVHRCEREDELLDALERRFVPGDLLAHIDGCSACRELHSVAGALLDERVQAIAEASVPGAAAMWWRIRMRRQHELETASRRSLLAGQAATLAIALLLVGAFFGFDAASAVRHAITSIRLSMPLLVGLGIWLVLAPLAGWVAIRQK